MSSPNSFTATRAPQSKRSRLFVIHAKIYSTVKRTAKKPIPLPIQNNLPAIEILCGRTDENEIPFLCHIDSCAGMNTGSLLLHQWIITSYPEIVKSYQKFDDPDDFDPLLLD